MPSRLITLVIVAFWLGVNGWYLYSEFAPRFVTGAPPPFVIDVVDEASRLPLHWEVLPADRSRKAFGRATTEVRYDQKADLYDLHGTCTFELSAFGGLLGKVIGFSILALQLGQMDSFDPSQSAQLLKSLTGGLGIALLTTVTGLTGNILLGLQLMRLDRFADALVADALALSLTHDGAPDGDRPAGP